MRTTNIVIYSIWFLLTVAWNFKFPAALPFEDVFIAICLLLLTKKLRKEFIK